MISTCPQQVNGTSFSRKLILSHTLNVDPFLKDISGISPLGCSDLLGEVISRTLLLPFKGTSQCSTGGALSRWGLHYSHPADHSFGSQPCNTISTVSYATLIDVVCLPLSHRCCFSSVLLFRCVITCDAPLLLGPASGQTQCCPFLRGVACCVHRATHSLSRLSLACRPVSHVCSLLNVASFSVWHLGSCGFLASHFFGGAFLYLQ